VRAVSGTVLFMRTMAPRISSGACSANTDPQQMNSAKKMNARQTFFMNHLLSLYTPHLEKRNAVLGKSTTGKETIIRKNNKLGRKCK
jgi:hypothetical protein